MTFTYSDYNGNGTTSEGSDYTMNDKAYVSIGDTKFWGNNSYAHFYAGGTITVTPKSGATITKIAITTTGTSYNGYQSSGTYTASTGSVAKNSSNNAIVEWTGSATSAFTLAHTKQIRWTSIVVTYSTSGGSTTQPTALSVPSNLASSNVTTTGATLSWNAVTNASSYTVKIGETEYTGVTTTSYSATGLTAGTQYTWTVKAVGDGSNYTTSAYASNATFTTEAEQGGGEEGSDPTPDDGLITVWSEDFSNVEFPSGKTTQNDLTKITSATFEITAVGGTTCAVYKNDNNAGGTAPELLLPKRAGSGSSATNCVLSITINDLKGCSGDMVLTMKSNASAAATSFIVGTTTAGVTVEKVNGAKEWNINVPQGTTSLVLTFTNSSTSNYRIDDLVLKCEAPATPEPTAKTIDFYAAGTDGYYTTFSNDKAVYFPAMTTIDNEDVLFSVYSVYAVGDMIELHDVEMSEDENYWLSENEGYLIKAETTGTVAYTGSAAISVEYTELDYVLNGQDAGNCLRPASEAKTGNKKFYMLAYSDSNHTPASLGFYWGEEGGAAFTSRDNSAYLAVPVEEGQQAPRRFVFSQTDTATSLENVDAATAVKFFENGTLYIQKNGRVYNAMGQMVK